MVSFPQAIILSIIQGITEWFPISSSGHLALTQHFFGFQNLPFDVYLHFASIIAVLIIFKKDILNLLNLKNKQNIKYIFLIIIAIIPAFLFGVLFKKYIAASFHNLTFIGIFFIFSGLIIYLTKFTKETRTKIKSTEALFIGLMQVFALFPGISRSGMTISAGLFTGLKKQQVIKFSFLLAIPIILGASLAEAPQILNSNIAYTTLLISFIITLITSLITIRLLLKIIKSNNFYLFGIYNIVLGLMVLVWSLV